MFDKIWIYINGLKFFVVLFITPFIDIHISLICWFSNNFWDIHDYPVQRGGDGFPSHFFQYQCWHCGKEFGI
jgi:hypothetical protein